MTDWSNRPSEQRQSIGGLRQRGWTAKNQSQFNSESEELQDDIRGIKLAQIRVEKDIQEEKLEQKNIQLGIEKETTKQVKEKFQQAVYKTVLERTKTASIMEQTALATQSWDDEQNALKASLDSVELNRKNTEEKLSMDRRAALANFN